MASDRIYSPAEICEMFGVSKSTLFRWEEQAWFPQVSRDLTNQRQYTQEHIQAISRKLDGRQFEQAAKADDEPRLREITEAISLHKFLYLGDKTGLQHLAEYPYLLADTIRQLLRAALEEYEPGEETFCEIIRVVLEKSCRVSRARDTRSEE